MPRALRFAVLLLSGTVVLACPMKSAIWIVPGSTANHLEFGISDKRLGKRPIEWGGITVYDCYTHQGQDQHVYWSAGRGVKTLREWPTRVSYGVVPAGLDSLRGPESLRPGCYTAAILGTGVVSFMVDSVGGVQEVKTNKTGRFSDTTHHVGATPDVLERFFGRAA